MMKMQLWLTSFLFLNAFTQEVPDRSVQIDAMTKMNVAYGDDPKQKMDVYLPAGRSVDSTKVIVLLHGGSWSRGDKSEYSIAIALLRQKLPGYAVFNVNYRLAHEGMNTFPSQENDVNAAIDFIYANRKEYSISDKFVYMGASAGAHLALLQAYKNNTRIKPRAVVSFFAPTELTSLYNFNPVFQTGLAEVIGGTPVSNPDKYKESSPATYVSADSPPTIILQGGADQLVPASQAKLLKDLLDAADVPNKYIFYPTERHGWVGPKLVDSFEKIASFLSLHV